MRNRLRPVSSKSEEDKLIVFHCKSLYMTLGFYLRWNLKLIHGYLKVYKLEIVLITIVLIYLHRLNVINLHTKLVMILLPI
jgi:hypothetical protein